MQALRLMYCESLELGLIRLLAMSEKRLSANSAPPMLATVLSASAARASFPDAMSCLMLLTTIVSIFSLSASNKEIAKYPAVFSLNFELEHSFTACR